VGAGAAGAVGARVVEPELPAQAGVWLVPE
jgi:hypothetical protein